MDRKVSPIAQNLLILDFSIIIFSSTNSEIKMVLVFFKKKASILFKEDEVSFYVV